MSASDHDTDHHEVHDCPVDTRVKIAALWTATMLIFAYVDPFSMYRPDVRSDVDAGKIFVFEINQAFLFFATLYVIVPSVMIYLSLVLPRRVNRTANMVLAALYAVARGPSCVDVARSSARRHVTA